MNDIGIALGGGGARGLAHIGVLDVLQEAGISPGFVSGTSIGSLVGAAHAADRMDELRASLSALTLTSLPPLLSPTLSRQGMFSGKKVMELASSILQTSNFSELKRPFAAVSVDLFSSQIVTRTEGDLLTALRASIAIPMVFTPVVEDDMLMVDGGVLEPVPVEAVRNLGAKQVIASDLFGNTEGGDSHAYTSSVSPTESGFALHYFERFASKLGVEIPLSRSASSSPETSGVMEILERTLAATQRVITEYRFRDFPAEIVIRPQLNEVGSLDFHRYDFIVEKGREAAEQALPQIQVLLN